jgi:hypothetical protein
MLAQAINQIKEEKKPEGRRGKRKKPVSVIGQLTSAQMKLLKRLNPMHYLMVQRARDIQNDHPELGKMEGGFDWEFDGDTASKPKAAGDPSTPTRPSLKTAEAPEGEDAIKMHCNEFLTPRRKAEQRRVRNAKKAHDLHQQESLLRQQSVDDELSELFGGDGGGYAPSTPQTPFDVAESMDRKGETESSGKKEKKEKKHKEAAYIEVLELLDAIEDQIDKKKADLKLRGRICVEVRQCKALPTVQSIGKQDPIIIALLGHQLQKTDYVWGGSTDPVWRDKHKSKLLFDLYEKDDGKEGGKEEGKEGESDKPIGDSLRFEVTRTSANVLINMRRLTRSCVDSFRSPGVESEQYAF